MLNSNEFKRRTLLTLIKSVPYSDVILKPKETRSNSVSFCTMPQDKFLSYALVNFDGYSIDEMKNAYALYVKSRTVFELIKSVAEDYLVREKKSGVLCFKDDKALGWRFISSKIGDDILAASFLSDDTSVKGDTWNAFIFSDQPDMNEYAENHFHLKASCRTLEMNWVALMNYPYQSSQCFSKIDYALAKERVTATQSIKDSLRSRCMKASVYRAYLWTLLCQERVLSQKFFELICKMEDNKSSRLYLGEIDALLRALRMKSSSHKSFTELDYIDILSKKYTLFSAAFDYQGPNTGDCREDHRVLLGERLFLMGCFNAVLDENSTFTTSQKNIFYRYLIIRNDFREEMVQGNGVVGLKNFKSFQDRKDLFTDLRSCYSDNELPKMVLHETISRQVCSLEARIVPPSNSAQLVRNIKCYLKKAKCSKNDLYSSRKEVFFVLHYSKEVDKRKPGECRHYAYRRKLQRNSMVLKQVLNNPDMNYYIRGIDTCSEEIGCRPEVFGPFYRDILSYRFPEKRGSILKNHYIQATYHVGEDFLDLPDGLRSIDEVLLFCGYRAGCRLGHALALGVNPYNYYKMKRNSVCLSKQDHLDNLVWMYKKGKWLHLNEIVGDDVFKRMRNQIADLTEQIGYGKVSIIDYYKAWMLRGDKPELYSKIPLAQGWYKHVHYPGKPINDNLAISKATRDRVSVQRIIHNYHYSSTVAKEGSRYEVYEVEPAVIKLVELLQNNLMNELETKEICVESNPSSNLEIGPFTRYDEHPIIRLNSTNLLVGQSGHRVNVSINTDDIGIFDTALENEYVLMRKAMEQARDDNGVKIYHDVDKWIECIRKNGLKQSFKYEEMKE